MGSVHLIGGQVYMVALVVVCTGLPVNEDSNILVEQPADATKVEGQSARFACRIENVPMDYTVQWSIDKVIFGPWNEDYHQGSFSYPRDGDISVGTYDLVINPVSWLQHGDSTYECQVLEARKRSREAVLTVVVPPTRADILPTPDDGLLLFDESSSFASVSCQSNYASPGSEILWLINGQTFSGKNSYDVIENQNGAKLERITSLIIMSRKRPNTTEATVPSRFDSDQMVQLEKRYESVYHFACIISNPVTETNASTSGWVAFQSTTFAAGRVASIFVQVLIGVVIILSVASVSAILFVVYWRRRRSHVRRNGDVTTIVPDEGLCSSPTSVGCSAISVSSSFAESKNDHMLHGQMEDTTDSCIVYGDPFARGDISRRNPAAFTAISNQDSTMSSANSREAARMRDQVVRFLDSYPSDHSRILALANDYDDRNTCSLPRASNYTLRNNAVEQNTGRLSTFASLPRQAAKHTSENFKRFSHDSLPPPPPPPPESPSYDVADEASYLPPPMPTLDPYSFEIRYNVVCPLDSHQPSATFGRGDGEGMSEVSLGSGSPCTKYFAPEQPGSLV